MMIPPESHDSIGSILREALIQFKMNTALIEVKRKRETERWTYREFAREAEPLARRLQDLGVGAGDRVAIVMSNQAKWLISAYAAFFRGAVLIPIDYKLEGAEQASLLQHCKPAVLITEYASFRDLGAHAVPRVLVTEAPPDAELHGAARFEDTPRDGAAPDFVDRGREDTAAIVYSSGTGGRPKGCMLSHGAYLSQLLSLTSIFPLETGDRYFSILPTNHAIDFMCGFIGPFSGGATVVHQRALRPEFIRHTMRTQKITHMALVPLILEAFERTIREKLDELSPLKNRLFEGLRDLNQRFTKKTPNQALSSRLLKPVHEAFGGHLKLLFCGGAFVDRARAQFFYDLGLPVVIGYGLTEACTVITVNDLKPFRADSVGAAVTGAEIEIRDPNVETGIGEVWVNAPTIMQGYLDDAEQTSEVLQDGWLKTGDLGWLDGSQHLHLVGRSKNMIVTAGGKNIYPEDIEAAFEGLDCEELVVFASGYVWPGTALTQEALLAVVRGGDADGFLAELKERNRRLPDFKRVSGVLPWSEEFPRTASMKVKRGILAEELRAEASADQVRSL